jgi:two-component system response regulator
MQKGGYILCVDDDEDDYQLLAESFSSLNSNVRVELKNSGDEALRFLQDAARKSQLPRIIVLDLNMPGLNGKQTLALIRSIPGLENIPVIIFSTNTNDKDIIEIEKKGVSAFRKPNTTRGYEDIARTIGYMMLSY